MPTITLNVHGLWTHWQPSQREQNIHLPAVLDYVNKMQAGLPIKPISIEGVVGGEGGIYIRTLDGRHRLAAAHKLLRVTIEAEDTPVARQVQAIFNL